MEENSLFADNHSDLDAPRLAKLFADIKERNSPANWAGQFQAMIEAYGTLPIESLITEIQATPEIFSNIKTPHDIASLLATNRSIDIYADYEEKAPKNKQCESIYLHLISKGLPWNAVPALGTVNPHRGLRGRIRDMWNTTNAFYQWAKEFDPKTTTCQCSANYISAWINNACERSIHNNDSDWGYFRWTPKHPKFYWYVKHPAFIATQFKDAGPCQNPETYFPRFIDNHRTVNRCNFQWDWKQ